MSLPYIRHFLSNQWLAIPSITTSFANKTVIVTGSNTGLGLAAAQIYVEQNASKVILAVRSPSKGQAAKSCIEAATGNTGVIEVWELDMASYASIEAFVQRCEGLYRVDVLLENAGVFVAKFERTGEDVETQMGCNVYGTFYLMLLMVPVLERSAKKHNTTANLGIVASDAHHFAAEYLKKARASGDMLGYLNEEKTFDRFGMYNLTKLVEVLYVREFARHFDASSHGVVLNTSNPGLCKSELGRDTGRLITGPLELFRSIAGRTAQVGARTLVHPTTVGVEGHGKYSSESLFVEKAQSRYVRSEEGVKTGEELYNQINAALEKVKPGILKAAVGP